MVINVMRLTMMKWHLKNEVSEETGAYEMSQEVDSKDRVVYSDEHQNKRLAILIWNQSVIEIG